ncbi:MAG: copper oxidase [Gammaproteobacteria bacterium]
MAARAASARFVSCLILFQAFLFISGAAGAQTCQRKINADVVALPQPIMLNRLGAALPDGLVFALKRDTVAGLGNQLRLRADKRPRPIVLRANVGDCLKITLTNSIPKSSFNVPPPPATPTGTTSEVSIHVQGLEWVAGSGDDGSFVGKNTSSLASASPVSANMPPATQTYTLFAKAEGTFLLYTMGDTSSNGNQLTNGLFGAVNVQPAGAEWYRSQVTQQDLKLATKGTTPDGHPIVDYNAVYPAGSKYPDGTTIPPNTPILKMLDTNLNIVHTDLTAMITGPNAGRFPGTTGVNNPETNCNAAAPNPPPGISPLFCKNPASPDRKQPYREITIIYHGALGPVATQAFPILANAPANATPAQKSLADMTQAGQDSFAINYGTGGIGAEIYANRIGVGPMGSCVDCKFEEFFLSAWAVGDPAMLVDRPANVNIQPPLPTPAQPPVPPPPPLCTAAQFGDTGGAPDPNCANARKPVPPAVTQPPYTLAGLVKATRAYYPDDPSNVYHSYINDHLKFRILHGGRDVTHVHHQHAHQWLQSPNSDEASYLDSQMISPGASYTLEMVYNGSGNRNKVVGDSIFHCHFYPHFAAGMWAMWRTHDVFEGGSELKEGIPVKGTRALPDGEILAGTPIPAIVPLPTIPMAPLPSSVFIDNGQIVYGTPATPDPSGSNVTANPGFPFFIPGVAGARAPHPPLDFASDGAGGFLDGGLPRHVVTGGSVSYESHDLKDWSKDLAAISAIQLPELGTPVEQVAMKFFGKRCYATFFPDGTPGSCPSSMSTPPQSTMNTPPTGFIINGLPRKNPAGNSAEQLGAQPGAPFADPAVDDNGNAVGVKRVYKAAAIQANVTFNKKGWHYPQQRMLTLWKDVQPTIDFTNGKPGRQPEPLFFRGNSGDIVEYWHTNLVPNYYLVDDFQVRTPTDILGQHIHLVKFDVTSSDGAGNGFNYEDGTFSPEEVQEMIRAINADGGLMVNGVKQLLLDPADPQYKVKHSPPKDIFDCVANPNALRCQPCPDDWTPTHRPQCLSWLGAQTTIQRWYLDPQVDAANVDRTVRTVFTHDHFGPSTHQQAGLYAGLLVEPKGSTWTGNDGEAFGSRSDGGPTSWQARILTSNSAESYREFALEFQDLQLAYFKTANPAAQKPSANPKVGWINPSSAINPPSTQALVTTGVAATPAGTQSVNYANEPIVSRLAPQNAFVPPSKMIDMSYVFDNSVQEALNAIPGNLKVEPDPMTPLMRAYQNDNIQVRVLVGAHVFAHQFNFQGPTWFAEPAWKNSGYRSAQAMGLSEHFEFLFKVPSSSAPNTARKCPDKMSDVNCVDYLYSPSFDEFGLANGLWGLFRAYDPTAKVTNPGADPIVKKVVPLPNNPIGPGANVTYATCPASVAAVKCVAGSGVSCNRVFNITAVTAENALANKKLVFNDRGGPAGILQNDLGIMYVRSEDLDGAGKLKPGVPIEPLVLRANAGDCIEVNLINAIASNSKVLKATLGLPPPLNGDLDPHTASRYVGLHPQLLAYDPAKSSGLNVGWNTQNQVVPTDQAVTVGKTITYQWYAGKVDRAANGSLTYTPVELGSLNLFPSDLMFQNPNGLFGSMIIEPAGSIWKCGEAANLGSCDPPGAPTSRASATVTSPDKTHFREFSLMISDAIRINGDNTGAVNYRTEPWNFRYQDNITTDFSCMLSNRLQTAQTNPQTALGDPKTPIFTAAVGDKVRFRMTHPFGTGTSQVFSLHGHVWQRNPYNTNSAKIGSNSLSQWIGSRDNHGSSDHFDLLIDKAGGEAGQPGDYLYTVFVPIQARNGAWGIFRVGSGPQGGLVPNAGCPAIGKPKYQPNPPKDDLDRFTRSPLNSKNP